MCGCRQYLGIPEIQVFLVIQDTAISNRLLKTSIYSKSLQYVCSVTTRGCPYHTLTHSVLLASMPGEYKLVRK